MLFSTFTTLILSVSSISTVAARHTARLAADPNFHIPTRRHHREIARAVPAVVAPSAPSRKRSFPKKRTSCRATHGSNNSTSTTSGNSGSGSGSGSSSDGDGEGDGDDSNDDSTTTATTTTHSHHSTATSTGSGSSSTGLSGSSGGSQAGGVVHLSDSRCGSNNPSSTTTKSSGPNGEESWFNCGLDGSGWEPPMLTLDEMIYISLEDALGMPNTPYKPCESNLAKFNSYGAKYNLPPIMLASFAMQESTCSQDVYNSAGTIGMFQLAPENCPGVDCHDLDTNFDQACKLIVQYLSDAGNNVLGMVGAYNGWYTKMTASKAKQAPCNQQQNLDYLQQWANAWMQGQNGYNVGTYQNCAGDYSKRKRSLYVPRFARDNAHAELGWHF